MLLSVYLAVKILDLSHSGAIYGLTITDGLIMIHDDREPVDILKGFCAIRQVI